MNKIVDNFKINLNQNLWALLIFLLTIGAAEYFKLCTLYVFGIILCSLTGISFIITLIAYTKNYWNERMNK